MVAGTSYRTTSRQLPNRTPTITAADRKAASALAEKVRQEASAAKASSPIPVMEPRARQQGAIAILPSRMTNGEPQALNERKHQAFLKLAPPRMSNLIHYFEANILVLAATERYDYTLDEAQTMIAAVEKLGHDLRDAFQQRGKRRLRGEFSF